MPRADFAVRPARDRRRVGLSAVGAALLAVLVLRSLTGMLLALFLVVVAVLCLRPRAWTRGDTFVMRGIARTRRLPKVSIQKFAVREGLPGRQYVELVTRDGLHLRIPGTDRPVPRHAADDAGARTPAEAVCNRLHLWHMVSTF